MYPRDSSDPTLDLSNFVIGYRSTDEVGTSGGLGMKTDKQITTISGHPPVWQQVQARQTSLYPRRVSMRKVD